MADHLSPAAQAVMDAAVAVNDLVCTDSIAAVLRAAATDWEAEIKGQFNTEFIQGIVNCIMALKEIAAELEGNDD
jgi:hypothetical protein